MAAPTFLELTQLDGSTYNRSLRESYDEYKFVYIRASSIVAINTGLHRDQKNSLLGPHYSTKLTLSTGEELIVEESVDQVMDLLAPDQTRRNGSRVWVEE